MLYVIADDLTGAAEIAGISARYGLRTSLSLSEVISSSDLDVLVIATETRQMIQSASEEETIRIATSLPKEATLFKKTDSALRGHVTAELEALIANSRYTRCLYLPANPSKGRIIREGIYYIDSTPLDKTPFSTDPEFPAWSAKIRERFPNMRPWEVDADGLLFYGDITCEEDIQQIIKGINEEVLLAGGADLFEQYLFCQGYSAQPSHLPPRQPNFDNALMVCGSTQSKGKTGWPASVMPTATYYGGNDTTLWTAEALSQLELHHHTQLRIEGNNRLDAQGAVHLREKTAETVSRLMKSYPIKELYIEGGATAYAILHHLGWQTFNLSCEYAPGVVRLQHKSIGITIKPGSYSWPWT